MVVQWYQLFIAPSAKKENKTHTETEIRCTQNKSYGHDNSIIEKKNKKKCLKSFDL